MNKVSLLWIIGVIGLLVISNGCASEPHPPLRPAVPPPAFAAPPPLVFIPDMSNVYWVQDAPNLFFYGNNWYYYYGGWWYCSPFYNGPWIFIETTRIPNHFYRIPPAYFKPPVPLQPRTPAYHQEQSPDGHRGGYPQGQPGQGHGEHQKH